MSVSARKLATGSAMRVAHLLLLIVVGFTLSPFMIHRLGAEQYGLWALANAFVGYYSLLDLGLSGAVFTHMSRALGAADHQDATRIYSTGLSAFSALGAVLLVATLLIAGGILVAHPAHAFTLAVVVLIIGAQTAVSFPMRAPFGVLNAGSHFETTSLVLISAAVLRAAGTFAVLLAGKGVIAVAVVNILSWVPGYIYVTFAVHRQYPFIPMRAIGTWDKPTAGRLMRFGAPVLLGQIADRIRLQSDAIVVSFFYGLRAVTHYNIATTLVMYYMDGVTAVIGVLTPVLSMQAGAQDMEGMRRNILAGTRVAIHAGGFCAFGLIVWGHAFVIRWVGAEFSDSYQLIVVLTVAMFIDLWQFTAVNALYATMHQATYARINVAEAVANLLLSLALAKPLGPLGVAIGTLIPSVIIRAFMQPWIIQRKLEIPAARFYAVSLRAMAATAGALIIPYVISRAYLQPEYPRLFATAAACAFAFAIPIWLFEYKGALPARFKRAARA